MHYGLYMLAEMFPTIKILKFTSNNKKHFIKLDISGFDFSNGFRIEDNPE